MSWPRDDAKLERVRALMEEDGLDALVVRAPDNVLYLTNFWGMKGYDACVFPRDDAPVLICLELSLGTQASDRMVGEPTTFTKAWFDAFLDAADATPLLSRARALKTEQELA